MSVYHFAPSPDLSTGESNFATWEDGFLPGDIQSIIKIGEKYHKSEAFIGGGISDGQNVPQIRKSEVSWIDNNDETGWLYDKIAYIARQLNGQFFDFDLYGFVEHMQYTTYRPDGDHYSWHMDKGLLKSPPRKLSIVLQLSDPSEYDGGELQFFTQNEPIIAEKKMGLVYAFPSWIMHRVTPVTRGTRRSLVVWVAGPKFR